jgi:hypothetical protein
MQDLDAIRRIASSALDLNDAGIVVGASEYRAFVWDKVNGMRNLNDLADLPPGWTLKVARGVNDWGQIVAQGTRADGTPVAVLLTPARAPAR